ncbi:hypothetical protein SAMN05216480_107165 [Pustulibacterium marinum]|uniref:Uncharacterized protein n=1 Tax=Pustulibacterium marinum TaxID=1224947 RepID=A0A1I7H867_9FLAO|nr:hypothetical protein [Pustulibacterium marinum]SFU56656.1 hypothetical protein SAMN05216480_107165 [Pustulibacterium marinum]
MKKNHFTTNLKIGVFLIPLLMFQTTFSQTSKKDLVGIPDDQNRNWLNQLENTQDLTNKIELIKEKIHTESEVPVDRETSNNFWEDQVKKDDDVLAVSQEVLNDKQEKIKECNCKMEFKMVVKDQTYDLDSTKYTYTNPVLNMIKESTIDTVLIKNNFKNNSYLSSGQCGIIYLYSTNNKIARKIKKKL